MAILDVLTDVARTGRLGPVFCGARWTDVSALLGEPWEAGSLSEEWEWPRLFGYDDLEISVCRCGQVGIISVQTWRDTVTLPASIVGGTGIFPAAIEYDQVVAALDAAGCPWQPTPSLTFGDQCALGAGAMGASFTFEISEGPAPILNTVGLPGDGHDC